MQILPEHKVLVVGLDPSGQAACEYLRDKKARVWATCTDEARASSAELKGLEAKGVQILQLGQTWNLPPLDLTVHSSGVSKTHSAIAAFGASVPVASDLELASQDICCSNIGITGTNGKTTTAGLIQRLLGYSSIKTLRAGGSGLPVCAAAGPSRDQDYMILEVNSFQLASISQFRASIGVLLNLKPDFMDRFDRMSNYVKTLARIFENQQVFDWAIVQSEALAQMRSLGLEAPSKIVTFSASNRRADIFLDRGLLISRLEGWTGPLMDLDDCKIRGPHNAENIMAALAVGHVLKAPLDLMVEAVKSYEPDPHRSELIAEHEGVSFINDSKAMNVDAVQKSIEAIPQGRGGEPNIWLIAGGRDKGLDFHDLGPLLAARVKGTFLIGEAQQKLSAAWGLFTPCVPAKTLLEAVVKAADSAAPGDVVLLSPACSSFDMFQNYQHRGEVFRQSVAAWLKARESKSPAQPDAEAP